MVIVRVQQASQEKPEVDALREASQLGPIVQPRIDQSSNSSSFEPDEEVFGGALCKTDRIDLHSDRSSPPKSAVCPCSPTTIRESCSHWILPLPRIWARA